MSNVWDTYEGRITARGGSKRNAILGREQRFLKTKLGDSLSYHTAKVGDVDRNVAIINSDLLNEKTMLSLPGETFNCGLLVEWEGGFWLIAEKDANTEVYTRVKLLQCNHLLKWIDKQGVLHEQWCVVEDGTKYLTGEYEDRHFIVTRGDARIAITIGRNANTSKFSRGSRFIVDDDLSDTGDKMVFALTKPLKVGRVYNNEGVYKFVLSETVSTDDDHIELGIAEYYKYFPREGDAVDDETSGEPVDPPSTPEDSESGKGRWL